TLSFLGGGTLRVVWRAISMATPPLRRKQPRHMGGAPVLARVSRGVHMIAKATAIAGRGGFRKAAQGIRAGEPLRRYRSVRGPIHSGDHHGVPDVSMSCRRSSALRPDGHPAGSAARLRPARRWDALGLHWAAALAIIAALLGASAAAAEGRP